MNDRLPWTRGSGAFAHLPLERTAAARPPTARLLFWILLAVLFTPSLRLPGNVPFRLDDMIVFGAGAGLMGKWLLNRWRLRPDPVFFSAVAVTGAILLSTILAPGNYPVGAKEYLDCLRPVKFLLVYWLARECDKETGLRTFLRTLSISIFALFGTACMEMFFARLLPSGLVVRFFSLFTEKEPGLLLDMMATRPFATFNTPPDLGYVACVLLFAGPLLAPGWKRRAVVAVCFLTLLITASRTLLFALPLLLGLQALLRSRTGKEALRRMGFSLALIGAAGASAVILLPLLSPHASDFTESMIRAVWSGDTSDEDSITTRLGNLYLVDYTWTHAPLLGVGTRALLPDYVDSELILTYHRYGAVGLMALLLIYPAGFSLARRAATAFRELYAFVALVLAVTFLVGITLGALDNSRVGVLPFVILGLAASQTKGNLRGRAGVFAALFAGPAPAQPLAQGGA